ncbi:hypothetical protein [Calothrix sp. PCC 7507]|uniref:hypothetical protein n=1 Tax=Calothrix sp. PCC 7507 TaxID=99598 RepID=UPI00029EE59C|nr:hypothetical protein [Calothrix sp. PCC 7507]AFY34857.1 hypothetical protein Cal7507_4488 [Calothrix sp. PCC 7507]
MISGIVTDGHAIIAIPFRIPNRADFPIEFVIDTGFTDERCLPSEAVALLNLPFPAKSNDYFRTFTGKLPGSSFT